MTTKKRSSHEEKGIEEESVLRRSKDPKGEGVSSQHPAAEESAYSILFSKIAKLSHEGQKKDISQEDQREILLEIKKKTCEALGEEEESATYKEMLQRLTAEFDNYRKRVQREKQEMTTLAASDILKALLPISDSFELSLNSIKEGENSGLAQGLALIHQQILALFSEKGLKKMDCLGKPFDPTQHQAIQWEESDQVDEEQVSEVYQNGYTLGDRVLRLATVKILKPKQASDSPKTHN